MIKSHAKKLEVQRRRRRRVKSRINRYTGKPRLVVTRSAKHITGQVVDDLAGQTLVSASSIEKALTDEVQAGSSKTDVAKRIGRVLGHRAAEKKIKEVVFDRSGHLYHGRIRAFADGAREGGLNF
ncbi:MAG: 50S ribosomal protein L18 [Fidelibacterota bacterium]|nr:MAG: 50S ribosomal protein L18 [Candidatus Neomarinimicrobiota bacterium]